MYFDRTNGMLPAADLDLDAIWMCHLNPIWIWFQDLKSGIPICNLARVKARGDLDLDKSDAELSKLGKHKDHHGCCQSNPCRLIWCLIGLKLYYFFRLIIINAAPQGPPAPRSQA